MKSKILGTVTLLIIILGNLGCSGFLTKTATPTSLPVQLNLALTNDPNTVAWLQLAANTNAKLNPTPTEPSRCDPLDHLDRACIRCRRLRSSSLRENRDNRVNYQHFKTQLNVNHLPRRKKVCCQSADKNHVHSGRHCFAHLYWYSTRNQITGQFTDGKYKTWEGYVQADWDALHAATNRGNKWYLRLLTFGRLTHHGSYVNVAEPDYDGYV